MQGTAYAVARCVHLGQAGVDEPCSIACTPSSLQASLQPMRVNSCKRWLACVRRGKCAAEEGFMRTCTSEERSARMQA